MVIFIVEIVGKDVEGVSCFVVHYVCSHLYVNFLFLIEKDPRLLSLEKTTIPLSTIIKVKRLVFLL